MLSLFRAEQTGRWTVHSTTFFLFCIGLQFAWLGKTGFTLLVYGILLFYWSVCWILWTLYDQHKKSCIDDHLILLKWKITNCSATPHYRYSQNLLAP